MPDYGKAAFDAASKNDDKINKLQKKGKNLRVDVVEDYGAKGNNIDDDFIVIQQAITDVYNLGGGVVFFPKPISKYRYSTGLLIPPYVKLDGIGEGPGESVLNFVGSGWAMATSGIHQRNKISNIRLETNGNASGLRIGDKKVNLANGVIPINFKLENFTIANIASGFTALELNNVSHITMNQVRTGFGSITGGNALKIYADGDSVDQYGTAINGINSGVFSAVDCIFGRVDSTDVALEIDGTANLDSYMFIGTYFGGQRIQLGKNATLRSVNFHGCHGEFRLLPNSSLTSVNAFEMYRVLGGGWYGGSITCFGAANSTAFWFQDNVRKFNIKGVEANGVMGAIFKQTAGTVEGCELQEANLTGGSTATQFVGVSEQNFKLLARRFQTENINVRYIYSLSGNNKMDWGSQSPTLDTPTIGWTRGDYRMNTFPSELGTAGSKYVLNGWKCIAGGTPGTWVEDRGLTGN
ncbi:hypothetical protein P4639_14610 [Priestia megaterium]|uniref:hypothetical protein n=1 Tax=Priestia megaterium TaxID=1404 RepID=UPI002E1E677D|nr:hypothetical protein [Priestia megaterium]